MGSPNNKVEALQRINALTEKARILEYGTNVFDYLGQSLVFEEAQAWNGAGATPDRIQDLLDDFNDGKPQPQRISAVEARDRVIAKWNASISRLEQTENMRRSAIRAINNAGSDTAAIAIFEARKALFENLIPNEF